LTAGGLTGRPATARFTLRKGGTPRLIVIPKEKEVDVFIIKNNLKMAKMTRERFFELLRN
jgi:hypothetical protein